MWNFKKDIYKTRREDNCPNCIANDVIIGTQTWTGCNTNTEYYNNGDLIPQVTDQTTWNSLTTGAWCWYNNDPANEAIYGKLYNWYAVTDPRGLAPTGYHVPSDAEWTTLTTFLGGEAAAEGKLKEEGLCHWNSPNANATDEYGFAALGGGIRYTSGYGSIGQFGSWWTSTILNPSISITRDIYYNTGNIMSGGTNPKVGLSVRFIKDILCPDVTIGTQVWTSCNLNVTKYRDGSDILHVTDTATWSNLSVGAWCYYNNDPSTEATYGKLYNWYAVNDPKGLAPIGYHVPSDAEYTTLSNFLGGLAVAGGQLKETGITNWLTPNTGATNSTGFTAVPGGQRDTNGNFSSFGIINLLWTSSSIDSLHAYIRGFQYNSDDMFTSTSYVKDYGMSIRLVKD